MKFQPQMLQGPARFLSKMALFILENNVDSSTFNIKLVENKAEYLSNSQMELIKQAFNCKVSNLYGAHECWAIAYSCEYNKLHIIDDSVYVEVIDDKNNVLEYGQEGDILITSLNSKLFPFIRYKIGDRGYINEICNCGDKRPYIVLSGYRNNEYLTTKTGKESDMLPLK